MHVHTLHVHTFDQATHYRVIYSSQRSRTRGFTHDQHLLDVIAAATSHSVRYFNNPYLNGLGYFVNTPSDQASIDIAKMKNS